MGDLQQSLCRKFFHSSELDNQLHGIEGEDALRAKQIKKGNTLYI